MQALLAAGLPIPLEDAAEPEVAARLARYRQAGLAVETAVDAAPPLEWLKATAILAITAVLFRLMSRETTALMDLSALPALAALYTLAIALVTWAISRRKAGAVQQALATARGHLTTAAPIGPASPLITRIRALRREVVAAGLEAAPQGELLRPLFDLEITLRTDGTLPVDVEEAIEGLSARLEALR